MLTRFDTLSGQDPLSRAVDLTVHSGQRHFPVDMGEQSPVALSQDALVKALRSHGEADLVGALDLPPMPVVTGDTSAQALFRRMQSGEVELIGVIKGSSLVGLVTLNDLARYIQLHNTSH
jgi:CBS domain-containing protein